MDRRKFIRLAGGGAVAAAAAGGLAATSLSGAYPAAAVEAWQGPGNEAEPRRRALAYAITAPNPHNLQPWLVDLQGPGAITLYTDKERVLPETDPFGRQILIGHGAFLELLVIALAQQGFASQVSLWPQGELPASLGDWDRRPIARITLGPGGQPDALFGQILRRHTPKSDFDTTQVVAPGTLQTLLASSSPGSTAAGTVSPAQLPALRDLCLQAAKTEFQTPRTMFESVKLMRVGPEEILAHRDGITLNSSFVRLADAAGLFDRSTPPVKGSPAYEGAMSRYRGNSQTAMGFVWLSSPGNSRSQQIEAGRAFVRMQLKATDIGLGMHPMSQALQEFAEMQPHYEVAHQLTLGQRAPRNAQEPTLQMFCRLGYPQAPAPGTPRRPLAKFLVAA